MELSLAFPFPLRQFFEPGQVLPGVFDTARNSVPDKFKNELHSFQGWIEAHQEERIELRLECLRVDDLVVALPILDLGLRERMQHYQVKRPLVLGHFPVTRQMLDRKEVFIERNVEFSGKNLLRVKLAIFPKLLQDFACVCANNSDHGVEPSDVGRARGSNSVVD